MYIMHENVSFSFQTSLHVELSSTYLKTGVQWDFPFFSDFSLKYQLLPKKPQLSTSLILVNIS